MSICKRAFKTKEGKFRTGVIASVVLTLAILAGGIQWYSSTATPSKGDFNPKQMEQTGGPATNESTTNTTSNAPSTTHSTTAKQGMPSGDFHDDKFAGKGGHEGHGGSSNPFLVVLNYFAIWAAIIIPVYYIEKQMQKKKRKARKAEPQLS